MGSERISSKDIENKIDALNEMFKSREVDVVLNFAPRNGYTAVGYRKNGGTSNTLFCGGTKRNCYDQLETMVNTIHLLTE